MTVSTTDNRVQYNGDGSSIEFPFTFGIFDDDDIDVILTSSAGVDTTLTRGVDYDVTLTDPADLPSVGMIEFIGLPTPTPPAIGETVTIIRVLDYTQEIDILEGGPLPSASINEAHDRAVMLVQQIKEMLGRSMMLPITSTKKDLTICDPDAGKALVWNDAEDGLANLDLLTIGAIAVSTFIKTLLDDADAAAARGTLDAQQLNSNLTALAGLTGAADKVNYFTGPGAMALADLTSLGRQVLAATTQAALQAIVGSTAGGMSRRQTVLDSFRDVLGRPDFLYSGTVDFATLRDTGDAICYTYDGSQYAYLAFDGNDATYWGSNETGAGCNGYSYIGMKNLKRNVKAIKFLNYSSTNNNVSSVKIDYSTDGITWNNIQTTAVNTTVNQWQEFAVAEYAGGDAGLHSIRMLANSATGANQWCILTFILQYENILDVCTTGNAIKYDEHSSHPATNAFNNTIKTTGGYGYCSASNMSTGNHYLGQSGLASAVKAITIKNSGSGAITRCAKELRLSWKQNVGDAWIDLATVAGHCSSVQEWWTIIVPSYNPAGSHYFAIRPTTNCGEATWWVDEMEFYTSIGDLNLTASATDKLHTTFGAGFSSSGAVDHVGEVTANASAIITSVAGRRHFVYQERNSGTGALTYGSSPIVPQYGQAFDNNKHSLLHFDGADGSTVMTDEFGHVWVASGNAQIETGGIGAKWGTGYLLLDGTTDYITNSTIAWNNGQPFAFEFQFYTGDNTLSNQTLFSTLLTYGMELALTPKNTLRFTASSNNSSANICDTSIPYTASNNTWYKGIIEWDGYYYRVWMGTSTATMQLLINVKSSEGIYTGATAGIVLGALGGASCLNGGIDEFRLTIGSNRYGWTPVAETAAFGKYDSSMHFYDTNLHKMYKGNDDSTWAETQRVFLGEGYCDAHGFTDVTNYALQGRYDSGWIYTVASAQVTKSHNVGIELIARDLYWSYRVNGKGPALTTFFYWSDSCYHGIRGYGSSATRNAHTYVTGDYLGFTESAWQSTGYVRSLIDRGW